MSSGPLAVQAIIVFTNTLANVGHMEVAGNFLFERLSLNDFFLLCGLSFFFSSAVFLTFGRWFAVLFIILLCECDCANIAAQEAVGEAGAAVQRK